MLTHKFKVFQCQFQVNVKKEIERLAIEHLLSKRKQKSIKLNITKFNPQEYLLSKNLSISEVQNLYKLRNSMIDVKENFKSGHEDDLWCRTCSMFSETQQHLIDCGTIRDRVKGLVDFVNLDVSMAFKSIINQEKMAKNYTIILNARNEILSCDTGDQ